MAKAGHVARSLDVEGLDQEGEEGLQRVFA